MAARLALAAALLALLASLVFAGTQGAQAAPAKASVAKQQRVAAKQRPSFVVIQTDDQTLDQLYATFSVPGGAPLVAMPNTLNLIAARGVTFSRYYVSYPLCCPSRVSLLTGRYAHNHNVRGNVPPNGGYTGFKARLAYSHNIATWLQGAGYRTIHVGKYLNGYGDKPFDEGKDVPPGWSAWHSVLNADTDHYYYGYTLNDNGLLDGPFGDSGSWDTREYGKRDDFGCPYAPLDGSPCLLRDRRLQPHRLGRDRRHLARTALLPADRLHRPARRLPPPGRARAGDPPLRHLPRRPLPAQALGRLQRGQRQRQAALHPRSALPLADRPPHLPRLLPEGAGVAALDRRRGQDRSSTPSAASTGCATPTSSSPPTTASSTASTG